MPNNQKVDIVCSDDYANIKIGNLEVYFGYEYTHCTKHGFSFHKCDCTQKTDWAFCIRHSSKYIYSLKDTDIEKRSKQGVHRNGNPLRYALSGLLLFLLDIGIDEIANLAANVAVTKPAKLSVCFSGFRDKFLESCVVRIGGKVVKSVTKDTTYLVVQDGSLITDKVKKAATTGVEVITKGDLEEYLKENLWGKK